MSHRPRKRFGQNFLKSQAVINHILASLNVQPEDHVIEIGPGMGALTQPLLQRLKHLTAIEIDWDLHAYLQSALTGVERLKLVNQDALTVNYSQFGHNLRIIGNLPYNISTPLMIHLLLYTANILDMHFMLQKEMVERLAGQPGSKDYGRLSVMIQYHCEVEHLFDVPADSFHPIPKVESAVVRLTPYTVRPFPDIPIDSLQHLVAMAFSMRRKTLANNLKPIMTALQLSELGINPTLRPEQISVMDYVRLTDFAVGRKLLV